LIFCETTFERNFVPLKFVVFTNCKVFTGSFWMAMFGGPTPKRHRLWSNCRIIGAIMDGAEYMSKDMMHTLALKNKGKELTKKYKDKQGKTRMCGTKFLKGSQSQT
jgi:hypothetical protein